MPAQPKTTLEQLLQHLGFTTTVEEHHLEEGLLLEVKADDAGWLIGRQGQTLGELQYILNRLLFHQDQAAPKVLVDVGNYRVAARDALVKKAIRLRGSDPQMEFAAALITLSGPQEEHRLHALKAIAGAKTDPLLAQNLATHFNGPQSQTISEMLAKELNLKVAKN